jgi:HEAT repeat protein
MQTSIRTMLVVLLLSPIFAVGQDCEALRSGSASEAVEYLRHAGDEATAAPCVIQAFHQIAISPPEQAIPLLVERLGYKRPLSEGEQHGIFMHGDGPNVLYPSVHELSALGKPAETALVHFIAENKGARNERDNALYALLLIHHGNAINVIETLMGESKSSQGTAADARLRAAAKEATKWCDDQIRTKCESIQK